MVRETLLVIGLVVAYGAVQGFSGDRLFLGCCHCRTSNRSKVATPHLKKMSEEMQAFFLFKKNYDKKLGIDSQRRP